MNDGIMHGHANAANDARRDSMPIEETQAAINALSKAMLENHYGSLTSMYGPASVLTSFNKFLADENEPVQTRNGPWPIDG